MTIETTAHLKDHRNIQIAQLRELLESLDQGPSPPNGGSGRLDVRGAVLSFEFECLRPNAPPATHRRTNVEHPHIDAKRCVTQKPYLTAHMKMLAPNGSGMNGVAS